MDVRPGGAWRFVMHGPSPRFRVTVTFAGQGGGTRLAVRMQFESTAQRDGVATAFGALQGLDQTLDRLEERLAGR